MAKNEPGTAVRNIESRKVYSSYFKARWQNLQNIVSDSTFYSLLKEPYRSYYSAYIKQWLEYSTGFVPMLHRQDFFSVGMGYTICDIFTTECMSNGYRLTSKNTALNLFMEDWAKKELKNTLNQMFFYTNAGGNSILSLTPIDGNVYPSAIPINRIVFNMGRRGEITKALILNRFTTDRGNYYARELRILSGGKPYYKVDVSQCGDNVTAPVWSNQTISKIPESIEEQWLYSYGNIKPGIWYNIPKIKTIGLYNVKNKAVAVAVSDLPGYSDSTLHTALDILYSIDYNFTSGQLDQHWGKAKVVVPRGFQKFNMSGGPLKVGEGLSYSDAVKETPLDGDIFLEAPGATTLDGTPIKPLFIQPDLRAEAHKYIRDSDLELLASKVGLSSSTLANHLTYNNTKTATEVNVEQDTTEKSVDKKRELAGMAIDLMLRDAAIFYEFGERDEISISWNKARLNTPRENAALLEEYKAGTMPLKEYLKKRHPHMTNDEVEKWVRELKAENSVTDIFSETKSLLG